MPKFSKLSQQEVQTLTTRRQNVEVIVPYMEYLKGLRKGDFGSMEPEEDESQRLIKRRLTGAAKQLGKKIRYRRSGDHRIIFEVQG